ncbi:hypothetical protein OO013_17110 [Mangrovivirga sp. M17]|uniref:Uncharacterized protein n=1 Tax=Mangrovivirga halotolerans TaxID=2993936 RepID=A0ABT3RV09_9BACT|nr:hypothetical protein [Mangrovivirga halotolerans]MCX2745604.1 hypothetical protein [Mangrovivirga halotolerans]
MSGTSQTPNESPPWKVLYNILRERRSRRFGLGMEMRTGPMAYKSRHQGLPLSEKEEALLTFAACGITGPALGDLVYDKGEGGTIMAGLAGRTIPSGDAIQTSSLIVMNPEACYYIKKPGDFKADIVSELATLAAQEKYLELYQRTRVKIRDGRSNPPLEPFFNINCNRWSLYDPSATYFLPIEDFTLLYINALLEIFNEHNGIYVRDERAAYRPAGIKKFAKSRGGHLVDDPKKEHTITIQQLETMVTEFVTSEAGMIIQNLGLMTQALGLGGFPHWAAHYYSWFKVLGFKMKEMNSTKYLGMGWFHSIMAKLLNKDQPVPLVTGLDDKDGTSLIKPFCPPNYPSMKEAVYAVVELKWGKKGIFNKGAATGAWKNHSKISNSAPNVSEKAVESTIAYCTYLYDRYKRFPVYQPPLRTLLGFQVNHVDTEFYDHFYKPDALSDLQRNHFRDWHGKE